MQTEVLKVTGMTCGGCTASVADALMGIPGVSAADVSLSAGEARVQYDERVASAGLLKSAVEAAGFGVGSTSAPAAKRGCCG